MGNIFLGKPIHWLVLAAVTVGMWYVGTLRLHVIHFNTFLLALIAISTFCVLFVLYTNKNGERLTRDEIVPDEAEKEFSDL